MKKNGKTVLICIAVLCAGPQSVAAEAVLLYLESPRHAGFVEGMAPLAAAVEDGIMAEFFENGHIIFNAGVRVADEEEAAANPAIRESFPVYLAKSGGASYLLEVYLSYVPDSDDDGSYVPTVADFIFSELSGERLLSSGGIDGGAIELSIGQNLFDLCEIMGTQVAKHVLKDWRDSAQTPPHSSRK